MGTPDLHRGHVASGGFGGDYSNYRRFMVETQEEVHVDADPDLRQPQP